VNKLIISTAMTVDGVTTVGEWYVAEGEHEAAAQELFADAAAMLAGRKTFEGLAEYWSPMTGAWADLVNPMPKFVASRTLQEPLTWNGTLIEGDVAKGVSKLKAELDGDLIMFGCGELARHLLGESLVDELRFWVHPVVWGPGERPFEGEQIRMQLLDSKAFDSGVMLLRYRRLSASRSERPIDTRPGSCLGSAEFG
jgi:dihydrofolate reductase